MRLTDFSPGANVSYEKSKIMRTYRSVKRRMQSRFMRNGQLSAKLFLVSSKKSDQDFIEQYVETVKDSDDVLICDNAQWEVKPPGTFSNKRFKVAVGNKKIHSRIVHKDDDLEGLEKQGYRIIDIPLELKRDFERDIDSSLMEFAGISSSLTTKFISYDSISGCYSKKRKNPFTNNIISIGTNDDMLIQDFFKPEMIDEVLTTKPIYIHIDTSLTGDRTGISAVAITGIKEEKHYSTEENDLVPIQELIYAHLFSIGIQCPADAEISLQKNREFIYYLKYSLGWNINGVSLDGFQSADSKQQLLQAGFDAKIVSLDRTPDGYMYLKASLNERRISMLDIPELEKEVINLERNNMTGKIDHPPVSAGGSKDISDSLAGALFNASQISDRSSLYHYDDLTTIADSNEKEVYSSDQDRVLGELTNQLITDVTKPKNLQEFIADTLNKIDQEQDDREERITRAKVNKLKKQLTDEERHNVRDDELEDLFCNDRDGIVIW